MTGGSILTGDIQERYDLYNAIFHRNWEANHDK
jgi:hypothetical protein